MPRKTNKMARFLPFWGKAGKGVGLPAYLNWSDVGIISCIITTELRPFSTLTIGSFPHLAVENELCARLAAQVDIPCWPQLPRRSFRESMYVQYATRLPGAVIDAQREKLYFDTNQDLTPALEAFYERYLTDDLEAFALPEDCAAGFYAMLEALRKIPGSWVKGQVTGPVSLGLTVTDQDLRSSLYNEQLADPLVKNAALNARWQIKQLQSLRPNVMMFVDEPYMASFGSAFVSLGREQVVTMLDEVFTAIHAEGALAGVHCCGNTDWSVLLATQVDILNLDAYDYLEPLALYPVELLAFLERGGRVAWGIVPNNEIIFQEQAGSLIERLRAGFQLIAAKAQARGVKLYEELLAQRSLLTTSCGLGPATEPITERALELLVELGKILQT
jgi:methionine synthase II (cobalamin-independent)